MANLRRWFLLCIFSNNISLHSWRGFKAEACGWLLHFLRAKVEAAGDQGRCGRIHGVWPESDPAHAESKSWIHSCTFNTTQRSQYTRGIFLFIYFLPCVALQTPHSRRQPAQPASMWRQGHGRWPSVHAFGQSVKQQPFLHSCVQSISNSCFSPLPQGRSHSSRPEAQHCSRCPFHQCLVIRCVKHVILTLILSSLVAEA